MRILGLLFGWVFMTLATVAISCPESWLGASRESLVLRGYAGSAMWFALAANYRKEKP